MSSSLIFSTNNFHYEKITVNMYIITLHNTETEEIVGTVTQASGEEFETPSTIFNEVHKTWKEVDAGALPEDFTIEDYVDYHNNNSDIVIEWVTNEFIQL